MHHELVLSWPMMLPLFGCAAMGFRHALCMVGRRHGWHFPQRSAALPPPRPCTVTHRGTFFVVIIWCLPSCDRCVLEHAGMQP